MTGLEALANAQAREEGFNVNGSLPQTLNNPGDLTSGGKLIQYPNISDGWTALVSKLTNIQSGKSSVYSPSESLSDFEKTYTGGDPNAAGNVASMLGVSTSTPLSSIFGGKGNENGSSNSDSPGILSSMASAAATAAIPGGGFLASLFGGSESLTTSDYLIRGVAIIGGLILIAGAVFGFDHIQNTVTTVASKGVEVAAAAA